MLFLDSRQGKRFVLLSVVLLATSGFAVPCAAQSYAELVLADEPFAYWRMDETSGSSLTNLGTNAGESASYAAADGSRQAVAPIPEGLVVLGVPGLADPDNTAVRFKYDELEDIGGKISIADSGFSNAGGPYPEKTIELWFNADDVSSDVEQVLYEQGGSTRGMALYIRQGKVYVGAHNSNNDDSGVSSPWIGGTLGNGEDVGAYVSTSIQANTTYHLALVMEGDADGFEGTMKGYLNGELFGEQGGVGRLFAHTDDISIAGVTAQTHFDADAPGGLFGDDPLTPNYFSGVIDEFALYNRALTAGRIGVHSGNVDFSADINGDGTVDLADFQVLSGNFNGPGAFEDGDINFDEKVNMSDFVLWRTIFQAPAQGASAAAVPEPAAGILAMFSLLALCFLRRRLPR